MEKWILQLKNAVGLPVENNIKISDNQILTFENKHGFLLPADLQSYFKYINGTNGEYDQNFFCLYSLDTFKSVEEELGDRDGVPNYKNLINTFEHYNRYFVFCDFEFHSFSYAIELKNEISKENNVFALCGDKYKLISKSFTDFIYLYLERPSDLFF